MVWYDVAERRGVVAGWYVLSAPFGHRERQSGYKPVRQERAEMELYRSPPFSAAFYGAGSSIISKIRMCTKRRHIHTYTG